MHRSKGPWLGRERLTRYSACSSWLAVVAVLSGCERATQPEFVASAEVQQLEPPLREAVQQQLAEWCGTAADPKLLGATKKQEQQLARGAAIYRKRCQQCHGVTGDGDGPASRYLTPRPRDFRRGIFKFTSTPYGFKPLRADLLRTVERGVAGTAMPSFRRLPERDREAVVDYVLALVHRGELEQLLAVEADAEGELTEEAAEANVKSLLSQWNRADEEVVRPAVPMPPITTESIAAGKEVFLKRECFKCHGRDGRGGLAGGIEVGNDAWGQLDPAADLTSGMLRGGQAPVDIYRRISAGINGTPMPAFKDAFASEPEKIWQLAHYVMSLADQRRRGVQFPPGEPVENQPPKDTGDGAAPESETETSTP